MCVSFNLPDGAKIVASLDVEEGMYASIDISHVSQHGIITRLAYVENEVGVELGEPRGLRGGIYDPSIDPDDPMYTTDYNIENI